MLPIEVIKAKVDLIVNDDQVVEGLAYLHGRWEDEKEYEDWNDYDKWMKDRFSKFEHVEILKGTKRPFGFIARVHGVRLQIFLKTQGDQCWLAAQLAK